MAKTRFNHAAAITAVIAGLTAVTAPAVAAGDHPVRAGQTVMMGDFDTVRSWRVATPEQFGAKGDGLTDDTLALKRVFSSVRAGTRVYLAPGKTYLHKDVVRITVPRITVYGGGTLVATNEERSALWVDADGVQLFRINLSGSKPTRRWYAYEQHRLRIKDRSGVVVEGVTVKNAAGAGVFLENASDFNLTDVRVTDSMADGIHMTGGTHDGKVLRPLVTGAGDDGVAVVSYSSDGGTVERIKVTNPVVKDQRWGRGVSVVGGRDITYENITVAGSAGAAVYIANEDSPYYTQNVENVVVRGGVVTSANQNSTIGHGAVLVYAGRPGFTIKGVEVSNLNISGTSRTSGREVGVICERGTAGAIALNDLVFDATQNAPLLNTCTDGSATVTNWVRRGARIL